MYPAQDDNVGLVYHPFVSGLNHSLHIQLAQQLQLDQPFLFQGPEWPDSTNGADGHIAACLENSGNL
jgi:hypothetical protein